MRLSIDGRPQGELPLKVDVSRNFIGGAHFQAKFEADGYETQEFTLERAFNGVAILDITSTVVSGGIDVLTGSLMLFSPTEYHVQMVPSGQDPQSVEVQHMLEVQGFALMNAPAIERDLARGGGEYLGAFATLLGDGDHGLALRVTEVSLRNRDYLARSPDRASFVRRWTEVLAKADVRAAGL